MAEPEPKSRRDLAVLLVRQGYAVIWQDCRGHYASEGRFTKYVNEAEDGFDAMVWIEAQPWNNSRIGTMGLSYDAHVQMAMACLNPPGLACMAVDSGGFSNAHECGIRQGGAFELKQITWAYNRAQERPDSNDPLIQQAIEAEDLFGWMARTPHPVDQGPLAGALGSRLRGLCAGTVAARHLRHLLEAAGPVSGGLLRQDPANSDHLHVQLV